MLCLIQSVAFWEPLTLLAFFDGGGSERSWPASDRDSIVHSGSREKLATLRSRESAEHTAFASQRRQQLSLSQRPR